MVIEDPVELSEAGDGGHGALGGGRPAGDPEEALGHRDAHEEVWKVDQRGGGEEGAEEEEVNNIALPVP